MCQAKYTPPSEDCQYRLSKSEMKTREAKPQVRERDLGCPLPPYRAEGIGADKTGAD